MIQFDFNKSRKIENSEQEIVEKPISNEENKITEDDILFKKFVHFVISDRHKKFKNLEIKQLPYNQAKDLVSTYTNEQLINWMVDSDESDWVVRPSFYRAIYNETKQRLPEKYNK